MSGWLATPRSLAGRLSAWFAVLGAAGLCLAGVTVYGLLVRHLDAHAQEDLRSKAELVRVLAQDLPADAGLAPLREQLEDFLAGFPQFRVSLLAADGSAVWRGAGRAFREPEPDALQVTLPAVRAGVSAVLIELDRRADRRVLGALALGLAGTCLVGVLVIAGSGWWLTRRTLEPLRRLARQLQALQPGALGQPLDLPAPAAELQPLLQQFNALLARVQASQVQLQAFNADVAHELRTPLAALISQFEVELARPRSPQELADALGSGLEELGRLASIVNDMLFLSQADRGAVASAAQPVQLAAEAADVLEFHEGALQERDLQAEVLGDARALAERGLLRRALSNLVGNAIRHARPGSTVRVVIRRAQDVCSVLVENDGETVPPEHLERMFDRFWRADQARGGRNRHGLGLAIVAAIARMHGGATLAHSADGRTSVGLRLQAAAPPRR